MKLHLVATLRTQRCLRGGPLEECVELETLLQQPLHLPEMAAARDVTQPVLNAVQSGRLHCHARAANGS